MPNIRSKINYHNKNILQLKPTEPQKLCNCLVKQDCPINGLCLTSSILYQVAMKCNHSKYKQKKIQRNLRNDLQEMLCKPQDIIQVN